MVRTVGLIFAFAVFVTAEAATSPAVVLNEIMYHPADPNPAAEFIEFFNAGDTPVDLSGWRFSRGVEFTFTSGTVIDPHDFLVICRDADVFTAVYGPGLPVAGQYVRGLSNAGEKLRLRDAADTIVQDMDYLDELPWPPEADGGGSSLELIAPDLDTDDPYSWRASLGDPTPGRENSVAGLRRPVSLAEAHHIPDKPQPGQIVDIQVRVNHLEPLSRVTLFYEVLRQNENVGTTGQVAMRDDGVAPDENAGDSIWTCRLPGRPDLTLVRYHFEAEDSGGETARFPEAEAITPNRAYFVADYVDSPINVWWLVMTPQVFSALESHVFTDELEPAAFVSDTGKVYDRIGIRYRGARARHTAKKSWKIVFNGDRRFRGQKRINLNAQAFDPALIREKLAYELFEDMGSLSLETEMVRIHFTRSTGGLSPFLGLFTAVEQANSRWVRRIDRDDAVVYKSFSRSNRGDERYESNSATYREHYDKETHEDEPWDDFIGLTRDVDDLFGASEQTIKDYFTERLNLDTFYGYMVANACIQNWDQFNKNHYMILDVATTGRWEMTPWDVDRVLGDHWNGSFSYHTLSPYLGRQADPGVTGWNRVMDRFLAVTEFREEYMRRLNQALVTQYLEARWWPRIDELSDLVAEAADLDDQKWGGNWRSAVATMRQFISDRRTWLLQTYFPGEPPETPVNVAPPNGAEVPRLPFTLEASPFVHDEQEVVHTTSRWQITREGASWDQSVVDSVSLEDLETFTVSQTVFEAQASYRWRVAYSGSNGGVSTWSSSTSFTLGDLGYVVTPIDLSSSFNQDVVVNAGDSTNAPFDAGNCSMIEDGYQGGVGLPVNGEIGPYSLGPYDGPNAVQLGSGSPEVAIDLPPGRYLGLNFLAGCGNGDADIHLELRYDDGSIGQAIVRSDDWYDDSGGGGVGGELRENLAPAIDGLDRVCGGDMQYSNDPGLFVWHVAADPDRLLTQLVLDPTGTRSWYSSGNTLLNVMALNAVETGEVFFRRGDVNEDGAFDISDAVRILSYLFGSAVPPACHDRMDGNDDGQANVADAVYVLSHLFAGGPPPPPPFSEDGPDPTVDGLECGY